MRCFVVVARERHRATAFGGYEIRIVLLRQKLTDVHLAFAVVISRINEIDAGIKDSVQNRLGLFIAARPSAPDAITTHFHRAVAELRDFQSGSSECSFR